MHKKFFTKIAISTIALLCLVIYGYADDIEKEIRSLLPQADSFVLKQKPLLRYEAYKDGKLIGYCFNTKDIVPEEAGFVGPIEILVAMDIEGDIDNLKILKHIENPEYAAGITEPGFLEQFKGKRYDGGFSVGEDVDNITHATVSVKAISRILELSLVRMQEVISGAPVEIQVVAKETSGILERLKKAGLEPVEAKYYTIIDE